MSPVEKNDWPVSAGDIARYTLVVVAILATALLFWQIKDAFLVAFAGIIMAVFITGFARIVRRFVPISRAWSLVTVGILITLIFGAFGFLFGPQIVNDFERLTERLPEQLTELRERIREWPLGDQLLDGGGDGQEENGEDRGGISEYFVGKAGGMLFQVGTTIANVLSTLVLIVFIGIFFAADPESYKKGIALLFTEKRANRINEVLETSGKALWQWLAGQLGAMTFVGITVTIGLMIIGVPQALVLGIIAGLLDFVPFAGPLAAVFPALVLAFSVSPQAAFYTALLYLIVQQFEGNMVTPLIQRRMVSLPPAMVILSLIAFGLIFGIPGIILATPLAVVVMVVVGMLYVEDVLGKDVSIPGRY